MREIKPHGAEKQWHVASWPRLAWLETAVKLIAILIGIRAFTQAVSAGGLGFPSGETLVQLIVMTVLSLGLIAAIFDRLVEREVVAMVFVILNNFGHWGIVIALLGKDGPGSLLTAFAALMLFGDLVKLVFLRVHGFQVRDTPRSVLFGLTLFYVLGYSSVLILQFV